MSVVVRMEMPKNCEMCRLRVNDSPTNVPNWICAINQWPTFYCKKSQNHANEDKYLHDCPILCQLPEGHGDLIDLETAAEGLSERYNSCHMTCGAVMQFLDGLPIIVPAERSEHERTD